MSGRADWCVGEEPYYFAKGDKVHIELEKQILAHDLKWKKLCQ